MENLDPISTQELTDIILKSKDVKVDSLKMTILVNQDIQVSQNTLIDLINQGVNRIIRSLSSPDNDSKMVVEYKKNPDILIVYCDDETINVMSEFSRIETRNNENRIVCINFGILCYPEIHRLIHDTVILSK